MFVRKENDLKQTFAELVGEIKKNDDKKLLIIDLEMLRHLFQEENKVIEGEVEK